jgi:hypothetical protein
LPLVPLVPLPPGASSSPPPHPVSEMAIRVAKRPISKGNRL